MKSGNNKLISNDLVSVKPLSHPTSLLFHLEYVNILEERIKKIEKIMSIIINKI